MAMGEVLKAVGIVFGIAVGVVVTVVLILALVWSLRGEELAPFAEPVVAPAVATGAGAVDPLDTELLLVEQEYAEVRAQLEQAIGDTSEGAPNPLEEGLGIVHGAIQEIVISLSIKPDNRSLKRILHDTYRKELHLLRKTLSLIESEAEAEENLEGVSPGSETNSPPLRR